MICLSERQLQKITIHQHRPFIQLPLISKSNETIKLRNKVSLSQRDKNQTTNQSLEKDAYFLKLPKINQKSPEKPENNTKFMQSQVSTQKQIFYLFLRLQHDQSFDNLKKYNKQIKDIQQRHNRFLNKIEELYMITKQQQ
ncbi:unnamed protein product (macronuclear) [Paramecium tetraurelia]|uniref:Uncharacterized protein n=1 Tax=Paramecium tetraurelia TaxID=5888 RepID=A0DBZ7_PARTE|nr:uncharacterized protein GSPATT00015441001 [Paramecium tetraurelia]CAK80564.1 unnamed protein product [Paramecium tetraurelia]|eukprot:XP_001447961.1 hypothetical protein (macronuclear) [Paramecium tetraurelia strain d4-2]